MNIYFSTDHHSSQQKIKIHTKLPPAHITSSCRAAQNCFESTAFNPAPSILTNMPWRTLLLSIALYNHQPCRETNLPTALYRQIHHTTTVVTNEYTERAPNAMWSRICSWPCSITFSKGIQHKVPCTMAWIYTGLQHDQTCWTHHATF